MKHQNQTLWLGAGVGSIALVVGYMVGASSTPIVSVAVPAVFGLVLTAVGFLRSSGIDERISALKETLDKLQSPLNAAEALPPDRMAYVEETLQSIKTEMLMTPERMGKVLVFFTALLYSRCCSEVCPNQSNICPRVNRQLPWTENKCDR